MRIFSHSFQRHFGSLSDSIYSSVSSLIPVKVTESRLPIRCRAREMNQQITPAGQMVIIKITSEKGLMNRLKEHCVFPGVKFRTEEKDLHRLTFFLHLKKLLRTLFVFVAV